MAFKVAVGAGHGGGGSTPGKRSPAGEYEWNFNQKVVTAFINELKNYQDVEIMRLDDASGSRDIPLRNRINRANRWAADVYISVHHNANTGRWGNWTGTETYYFQGSDEGKRLATRVHAALLKAYGLRDRGIKRGNHLYEVRATNMPSVLIEGGFMDSRIDIEKLRDDRVLKSVGEHLAQAVATHGGLKRSKGESPKEVAVAVVEPPKPKVKSAVVSSSSGSKKVGMIANIQATLNKRYNTKIRVDNKYGSETKQAVIKGYQTELNKQFNAGLTVDGIFGSRTKNATVNVARGAKGNLTWLIQAMLNMKGYDTNGIDGIYGNKTVNAVRKFQRNNGLTADGIFGKNTAEALFS